MYLTTINNKQQIDYNKERRSIVCCPTDAILVDIIKHAYEIPWKVIRTVMDHFSDSFLEMLIQIQTILLLNPKHINLLVQVSE